MKKERIKELLLLVNRWFQLRLKDISARKQVNETIEDLIKLVDKI